MQPSYLEQPSDSLYPSAELLGYLKRAAAVFVVSRLIYFALGVRFISGQLQAWQFLDPELLRHDLLRSVFYQHSQPPLFNLFTGAVLQAAGGASDVALQALFLLFGLTLYLALLTLMVRLGVSHKLAFAASTWFALSPSVVLYENWYFYTFPLASLLLLAALALLDFVASGRSRSAHAFFTLLAVACLTQSTFHPLLVPLVAFVVWGRLPRLRHVMVRAAALPLLVVLALLLKNLVLFGSPASSSWLGMSWARVVMVNVPEARRQQWVAQGKVSELALTEPFSAVSDYPAKYREFTGFGDVPALSRERKSTGETNYNHAAFLAISRQYARDCWSVLKEQPTAYVKGVLRSSFVYTKSTSDYGWLIDNRNRIYVLDEIYNRVFYGRVQLETRIGHVRGAPGQPFDVYVSLIVGLPLLLAFGFWSSFARRSGLTQAQRAGLLFGCACVAYVALVGNALESGENNRFRFMTDGFTCAVLALLVERVLQSRHATTPEEELGSAPVR